MAEAPDTLVERCRAAVLALPADAVFSHDTAVALGGWLIPTHGSRPSATYRALEPDTGTPVHVTVPSLAGRPRGRGLVGHRADLAPGDVIVKDGLLITSPWRTWCDLAAGGGRRAAPRTWTPLHKPDLSWPRWRVAADYDGRHHSERDREEDVRAGRASDWRLRQDTASRELLDSIGWRLRVFTSFDVYRRPERSVERMRSTLRLAGAPV